MYKFQDKEYVCLIEMTLNLVGQKWKTIVLGNLYDSPVRYNQLKKAIPGITQKMFTQTLKELEDCGLVLRTDYGEKPFRVEYSLTESGKELVPALMPLHKWGQTFIEKHGMRIEPMFTPPDSVLEDFKQFAK